MTTPVTYENWNQISDTFPIEDKTKGAKSVLEWAYSSYPEEQIVYASSFGAEEIGRASCRERV